MNYPPVARRLAAGDSYTFLMKELEKVDEHILEPLSGTDWPRDMPVITGGGIIESIASVDVTYASTGGEDDNLFFEAANDIPVIQADMSNSVARTFNFAEYMSFLNMEKLIQCHNASKPLKSTGLRHLAAFAVGFFSVETWLFSWKYTEGGCILSHDIKQSHETHMESCDCSKETCDRSLCIV